MIYILIIAALLIINFTNIISKLENKENRSNFDNLIIENYKVIFGIAFLFFTILFWRYSCFFLDFNC